MQEINLLKGEQMSEAFLAMNPEHVVPTLKDGEFVLWERWGIVLWESDRQPNLAKEAELPQ